MTPTNTHIGLNLLSVQLLLQCCVLWLELKVWQRRSATSSVDVHSIAIDTG